MILGPGGVPKGSKTSDYYRTFDIPERFDNPGNANQSQQSLICILPWYHIGSASKMFRQYQDRTRQSYTVCSILIYIMHVQLNVYRSSHDVLQSLFNAEWFEGYERKAPHPLYRTTTQDYGLKPNVHTMPNHFHGKSQSFSNVSSH